jgi:hypothetical protein
MQLHPIGLLSTPRLAGCESAALALSYWLRRMISRHHRAEAGREISGVMSDVGGANLDVT